MFYFTILLSSGSAYPNDKMGYFGEHHGVGGERSLEAGQS